MYYSSFNPNINLTKPLKNFGTFFTTIFIFNHTPPYKVQIWFKKIKFWQNLKGTGTYFVYVVVNVIWRNQNVIISQPKLLFCYFLQNNHATPNTNNAQPIINSHPVIGSNNTSNIPEPTPIRQTPIVFFNASNIYYLLFYIILFVLHKRASIYLFWKILYNWAEL